MVAENPDNTVSGFGEHDRPVVGCRDRLTGAEQHIRHERTNGDVIVNELRGPHYAVVVAEYPFTLLSTVIVVPFSSHARPASYQPETKINGTRTRALVEQVAAVSRRRLREPLGSLAGTSVLDEIDEHLRQALGLEAL
jgi:mRNA interferase MazF